MKKKPSLKFYIFLAITILLMITIFYFSAQIAAESDESSGSVIGFLERFFGAEFIRRYYDIILFLVRKSAHFTEYLLLGFFLSLTVRELTDFRVKAFLFSAAVCVLYAVSDEVHQLFVPGRSGEVRDILVDAAGSLLGALIVLCFSHIRRRKHEKEQLSD